MNLDQSLHIETFTDAGDRQRRFELEIVHLPGHGYAGTAREASKSGKAVPAIGYVFKSFAASEPLALARLRARVRRGLAQRFLTGSGASVEMPLERLQGHFDEHGAVVDGRLIPWSDFISLLQPYEGWEFELRIPLEPDW